MITVVKAHLNKKLGLLTLVPAGLTLLVFMILPLTIIIVFSLGFRDELGRFEIGLSLHNYWRFFQGPYLNCLWRSLALSTNTTLLCFVMGFPVSLWLAFSVLPKRQNLLMVLLVVPLSISFLLRIYAWITILRPTGLLPSFLQFMGLPPFPFLYSEGAILLGMVYNYLPYMILPLYACLEKIDRHLVEAAYDLGATQRIALMKVIFPLSLPGIISGFLMVFVPSLGDYITPDLMGGAKHMYIGSLIQNQYLVVRDWAFGSAASTILLFVVGICAWGYCKRFVRT